MNKKLSWFLVFCKLFVPILLLTLRPMIYTGKTGTININCSWLAPVLPLFVSLYASVAYSFGTAGFEGVCCRVAGTCRPHFERTIFGLDYKKSWMFFIPYIITYTWMFMVSFYQFLILLNREGISKCAAVIIVLQCFFLIMIYFGFEIAALIVCGIRTMKNINASNKKWEKWRRDMAKENLKSAFRLDECNKVLALSQGGGD